MPSRHLTPFALSTSPSRHFTYFTFTSRLILSPFHFFASFTFNVPINHLTTYPCQSLITIRTLSIYSPLRYFDLSRFHSFTFSPPRPSTLPPRPSTLPPRPSALSPVTFHFPPPWPSLSPLPLTFAFP